MVRLTPQRTASRLFSWFALRHPASERRCDSNGVLKRRGGRYSRFRNCTEPPSSRNIRQELGAEKRILGEEKINNTFMRPVLRLLQLGRCSYLRSLEIQQECINDLVTENVQSLIAVEHDPVYTVGIRAKDYGPQEESRLRSLGAEFCRTNRGGLITFHGPGQLVLYPIIHLKQFGLTVRSYVCTLEQVLIDVCAQYDVTAQRTSDTGVWVGDDKIAALGVHVKRYVTSHGISLNCDTDLRWFDHIHPCGIVGKGVTSLTRETGRSVSVEDGLTKVVAAFEHRFECGPIK